MMCGTIVKVLRTGTLHYESGLRLQKILADRHHQDSNNRNNNSLILLEHNPVYTVGIRNKGYTENDERKLINLGAEFCRTNRGGLITFHGPGQLVVYPILNLKHFVPSVKWYVCQIEKMVIRLCAEFGIKGETSPDTGVWVNDKKICAIGIHGSRYIVTHGFALNCNIDLTWFKHIIPCGIEGKEVTSLSKELGMDVTVEDAVPVLKTAFEDQFQCSLSEYSLNETTELLCEANNFKNKIILQNIT